MPYITPDLASFEARTFSQFGEDGVIAKLAEDLGIERGSFFEFGIGPTAGWAEDASLDQPLEGNFVLLRERGWHGIFLDGAPQVSGHVGIRREIITALNINEIYAKHGVPADLDFMSIDVDGQDFWIWMALQHRPKVMVIEYNGGLPIDKSVSTQLDVAFHWDGSFYQGASLMALNKLAKGKGYVLVWANGVNGIFVRADLVSNPMDFSYEALWKPYPPHYPDPLDRLWVEV